MTVTINIEAHPDRGNLRKQIDNAMEALGFSRSGFEIHWKHVERPDAAPEAADISDAQELPTASEASGQTPAATTATEAATTATEAATTATEAARTKRERGKPSPGRARRTKEEIAEDEAADRADAARQEAAVEAELQISTGENRVGPEDEPETAAQDAADEAAETARNGGLAPIDELRRVVGDYQKKFGMPAAIGLVQEGGLIGRAIVDVPEAEIPAVIAKVRAALDGKTEDPKQEAPKPAETPATKDDLQKAMLRYAKRFDGQDTDPSKMPNTMADVSRIFTMLFGDQVTKLSQVPADGYARAIAGIDEAIQKNPFRR